jgi:hypothetical protein
VDSASTGDAASAKRAARPTAAFALYASATLARVDDQYSSVGASPAHTSHPFVGHRKWAANAAAVIFKLMAISGPLMGEPMQCRRIARLFQPLDRKHPHRFSERWPRICSPIKDGLHRGRRQQRQPQHPADVGRVDLLRSGDLLDRRIAPGLSIFCYRNARAIALTNGLST